MLGSDLGLFAVGVHGEHGLVDIGLVPADRVKPRAGQPPRRLSGFDASFDFVGSLGFGAIEIRPESHELRIAFPRTSPEDAGYVGGFSELVFF